MLWKNMTIQELGELSDLRAFEAYCTNKSIDKAKRG
jgi:hypothetical protein